MKCKKCNFENQASARFCAECGDELTTLYNNNSKRRNKTSLVALIVKNSLVIGVVVVGFFVVATFVEPSIDVCDIKTQDEIMESSLRNEMNRIKDIAAEYQGGFNSINKNDSIKSIFRGGMFEGFTISKKSVISSADQSRVAGLLEYLDSQISRCSRDEEIQALVDELPFGKY